MQRPSTPLWQNRDYLLLWGGQIISSIGTEVSQFTFPLLVIGIIFTCGTLGSFAGAFCYSTDPEATELLASDHWLPLDIRTAVVALRYRFEHNSSSGYHDHLLRRSHHLQ